MVENKEMLEELRKIRQALEPPPSPPAPKKLNIIQEFKEFLKEYKVMGLAVAFIMGLYLGRLVQALVLAFISPILNVVFVTFGLISWTTVINNPIDYPLSFNPTLFISELITFIIVAFVIFILVKITTRMGID